MRCHVVQIWIVTLVGFAAAATAAAGQTISYGFGIGYRQPAPGAIAELYGGAIEFQGGIEGRWPRLSVAIEAGFHRSSASLAEPFFMSAAEGELSAVPIDLVVRFPIGAGGAWAPYAGVGFEALWLREKFRYRLADANRERTPDSSLHPGGLMVVGVDRIRFPRLRFEAFYSFVPLRRVRDSVGSTYEEPGAARINAGGYGARVSWRLP